MQTDTISHTLISRFAEPSLRCVPAQPGEPEQIKGHHNRQQNVYQSAWYHTGHKHRLAQRQGAFVALVWGKLEGNTYRFRFNMPVYLINKIHTMCTWIEDAVLWILISPFGKSTVIIRLETFWFFRLCQKQSSAVNRHLVIAFSIWGVFQKGRSTNSKLKLELWVDFPWDGKLWVLNHCYNIRVENCKLLN